jgi:hypothetical protein
MSDITIDVKALNALIEELMDSEVGLRCHIAASTRAFSRSALFGYANLLDEVKTQAVDDVRTRYRSLLEACETGKDIRLELSRLLNMADS